MWKLAALLIAASFSWAAGQDTAKKDAANNSAPADPWEKVRNLKTGSDLRIYKIGATDPVTAKSADVTDRKLIVIIGNSETAMNKSEIDRIDYQPPPVKSGRTKSYDVTPDSASMNISSTTTREPWKTIYQRTPPK